MKLVVKLAISACFLLFLIATISTIFFPVDALSIYFLIAALTVGIILIFIIPFVDLSETKSSLEKYKVSFLSVKEAENQIKEIALRLGYCWQNVSSFEGEEPLFATRISASERIDTLIVVKVSCVENEFRKKLHNWVNDVVDSFSPKFPFKRHIVFVFSDDVTQEFINLVSQGVLSFPPYCELLTIGICLEQKAVFIPQKKCSASRHLLPEIKLLLALQNNSSQT